METFEIKKEIIHILADGEFHSGTKLSGILNVSRTAVWKQLNELSKLGVEVNAVNGKGYRLARPIELFSKTDIYRALAEKTKTLLTDLCIHDQIHSTNDYLAEQALHGAAGGMVCLAEYQSAGKGRRGRQWVSPFGSNIYLSLLWRYHSGPAAIAALSLAVGIAIIRALKKIGVNDIGLKWPNDIYWRGKKLGGILIEVSGESEGPCHVIIGLGINMFLPEKEAQTITQDWVDLTRIMGETAPLPRNTLAAEIINELINITPAFDREGIGKYLQEWRNYDCMVDEQVILHMGNHRIEGIVQGIDDSGLLKLKHADGSARVYCSGEVSFNRAGCC